MATKYPAGSAGAKEAKGYKIFLVVAGIITLLLLLLQFVFKTEYTKEVRATPLWMNILGGIFTAGSWVLLYKGTKAGEEGSASYTFAWIILLALGFLTAAGFYSYTY